MSLKAWNSEESSGLEIKFESFSPLGVNEKKMLYEDPESKVEELEIFKLTWNRGQSTEETEER